jgi:hypothetical protein
MWRQLWVAQLPLSREAWSNCGLKTPSFPQLSQGRWRINSRQQQKLIESAYGINCTSDNDVHDVILWLESGEGISKLAF